MPEIQELINTTWLLITAALVMLMQAGFCCLESGLARSKNSINVAIKNLFDFCIASLAFWAFGYALMFGVSWHGLFGTTDFAPEKNFGSWALAFLFFQLVFCGTSTTIVSGAVAERMRFVAYLVVSLLLSGIIYPIFGHWAWGGANLGTTTGWLAASGFIDFAGSTVVHSVGGWVSLAAVLVLGPRIGRFDPTKPAMQPCNLPMTALGVFLLWFGWFGFNGGSTLAMNSSVPLILVNTNLAAAAGGASALAVAWFVTKKPDVVLTMNGMLAGLVGITANCHIVSPASAVLIGIVAGIISTRGCWLLEKLKIDDVVGAVPVHCFCGVWGTIAVAFFGDVAAFGGRTRLEQLLVQTIGVTACAAWAFGMGYLMLRALNWAMPMRVTPEQEMQGLNVAEHGAGSELHDLLSAMHVQGERGDFSTPVHVEPHTDVGEIAAQYNHVLDRVNVEIHSREEAVEAVRRAEAKFRSIFENAIEGIFQTTPDGRYLAVNPALVRIYGYDSADELVASVGDIRRQLYVDASRREEFVRQIAMFGKVANFESQIYRKDRSVLWISENARAVYGAAGNIDFYEGTVVDISDRMMSETLHREKEAAEAANRAKSQFLANMSHELRTPLNGVTGMLELLEDTELAPQQQRYTSIARSSADSLLNVINQILDFSKIEAGKLELDEIDFNVRSLIEETLEMIAPRVEPKGLELALNMPPDMPCEVRGDPHRLRQVIVNLLGNAIKFTQRGQIEVRVTLDEVSPQGMRVRIAIADTGIGIPANRLGRLFQSFSQVDASTTREYGGTGLGLAISKQIIELMQGEIGVHSVENQGSTFWFSLPLRLATTTTPKLHTVPAELEGMRILIVDDNATNREILFRQLSAWRFRAETAPDGLTALGMLQQAAASGQPFDLAIVDGHMSVMDGFELVRQIRTTEALQSMPLVMLTSMAGPVVGTDAQQLRLSGHLSKPVRQSDLFTMIVKAGNECREARAARMMSNGKSPSTPAPTRRSSSRAKLLLVEDNDVNREVAHEMLAQAGFHCEEAVNGREGIERLRREAFDVVLMDCQMPVMDGLSAAREIRRLEAEGALAHTGRMPIVAVTANAIAGDRQNCLAAGMDDYVTKPLNAAKLIQVLQSLLHLTESCSPPPRELAASVAAPSNGDSVQHAWRKAFRR